MLLNNINFFFATKSLTQEFWISFINRTDVWANHGSSLPGPNDTTNHEGGRNPQATETSKEDPPHRQTPSLAPSHPTAGQCWGRGGYAYIPGQNFLSCDSYCCVCYCCVNIWRVSLQQCEENSNINMLRWDHWNLTITFAFWLTRGF